MKIINEFKEMRRLYHFTSFETGKLILKSRSLRFGHLCNMNDIHECDKTAFLNLMFGIAEQNLSSSDVHNELYMYRQISLTEDKEDSLGFNLHQMWGLYGDKSRGICLVFDKDNLLAKASEYDSVRFANVNYDRNVESSFVSNAKNANELRTEIQDNIEEVFFKKRKEWEHEQEFRILKRCDNLGVEEYLYFGDALKYLILSVAHKDEDIVRWYLQLKELESLINGAQILVYGEGFDGYCLNVDGEFSIWNETDGFEAFEKHEQSLKTISENLK